MDVLHAVLCPPCEPSCWADNGELGAAEEELTDSCQATRAVVLGEGDIRELLGLEQAAA